MHGTEEMDARLNRAADLVASTGRVVAFTGAGVSTESGIPDFRSPTGLWARYDPDDFSFPSFMRSEEARRRYWAVGRELYAAIRTAEPNAAHRAIVALERMGLLDCVITQNVDDLHQRAGTDPARVIELHGNATRVRCLACDGRFARDAIQARLVVGEAVPACGDCGGILKPLTVLFGEPMPAAAVSRRWTAPGRRGASSSWGPRWRSTRRRTCPRTRRNPEPVSLSSTSRRPGWTTLPT